MKDNCQIYHLRLVSISFGSIGTLQYVQKVDETQHGFLRHERLLRDELLHGIVDLLEDPGHSLELHPSIWHDGGVV